MLEIGYILAGLELAFSTPGNLLLSLRLKVVTGSGELETKANNIVIVTTGILTLVLVWMIPIILATVAGQTWGWWIFGITLLIYLVLSGFFTLIDYLDGTRSH